MFPFATWAPTELTIVATLILMFTKPLFKAGMRGLAGSDGVGALKETFASVGIDLAFQGSSLLGGAMLTGKVTLSGAHGMTSLLSVVLFTMAALCCYGGYHRCQHVAARWAWATLSSVSGIVPFYLAVAWLVLQTGSGT